MNNQKLIIEGAVTYSRLFDALKGMYEVDNDDSVWEIFSQADDQIEEVVNALKLLSAPPAPFVVKGLPKFIEVGNTFGKSESWVCESEGYNSGLAAAINAINKSGGSVAE